MTKSKLIITLKLLMLFVLVKINLTDQSSLNIFNKIAFQANRFTPKDSPNLINPSPRILSFAHENIPLGNKRIDLKMQKVLKSNSFGNLQTNKLHYKAEKWFAVIEPILKKYGIPEDFKYLPLVESGLTTKRYSPKGAAGLWQFMPQTGRDFGLQVNGDVDERFDIRLSTVAAAKYLKSLHKIFGNWTLVAAAYNCGEGRIRREIRSQHQANYFNLKLNKETSKYVYSIISMKEIIEHPETYGYKINNPRLLAYQR